MHCNIPWVRCITSLYMQPYFRIEKESESTSPSSVVFSRKPFPKRINCFLCVCVCVSLFFHSLLFLLISIHRHTLVIVKTTYLKV